MLFNSLEFLIVFLPIVFGSFLIFKKNSVSNNTVKDFLTLSSFIFYGYWSLTYFWVLLFSITFNFILIRNLEIFPRYVYLFLIIAFNLCVLGFFKYNKFSSAIFEGVDLFSYVSPDILLPLGISFFTFQQIAYAVECSSGKLDSRARLSFRDYTLFVSFFPQLIAGPIVSLKAFNRYLEQTRYCLDFQMVFLGILFILVGLLKKVLFADYFSTFADSGFYIVSTGESLGLLDSWISLLAFSFQIYFDFSGYCDIAIGLGCLFNYRLPINFNSPYKAQNPSDFWRRWHITLSTFLKDYLFIPLGGSRKGSVKTMMNLITVMLVGGLWHGANLTFVFWGLYHGVLLAIHFIFCRVTDVWCERSNLFCFVMRYFWLIAICVGWVFFRSTSLDSAVTMLSGLLGFNGIGLPWHYGLVFDWDPVQFPDIFTFTSVFGGASSLWFFVIAFIFVRFLPNSNQICPLIVSLCEYSHDKTQIFLWFIVSLVAASYLLVFVKLFLGSSGEFIYFDF
jgi:alginate O-acetyltransferase complex protein AlgI